MKINQSKLQQKLLDKFKQEQKAQQKQFDELEKANEYIESLQQDKKVLNEIYDLK